MVKIGLAGLGFMGATHIKAYLRIPSASIAALCNPSGRNLDGDFSRVAGNIGTAEPLRLDMSKIKALRSFEDLIADPEIDVIDICAPTHLHREMALAALAAGKHVLCEKPLARTVADAEAIAAAASTAKGLFMPSMCLRFWPEWAWLREAIVSGRYGKVLGAFFRRVTEPPAWSQQTFLNGALSGGALLDLHIHDTDFVQFCFGPPKGVDSRGYSRVSGAVDHVVTHYDYDSPALVCAEGTWAMHAGFGFSMSYNVNFERATADYNMARGDDALRLFEEGQPAETISREKTDGYVGELSYFLDCVQQNREPTVVTAADGVLSVRICEAEERSALSRSPVAL
jgi:predicted dehydrogenase